MKGVEYAEVWRLVYNYTDIYLEVVFVVDMVMLLAALDGIDVFVPEVNIYSIYLDSEYVEMDASP